MIRIQNVSEVPDTVIKQGEKIKGIQTGKEEVKPPVCADNVKTKHSKEPTQKTPRTTEFSKIMGYNIKINYFKTKN